MEIYDHAYPDGKPTNVIYGREPARSSQIFGTG